MEKSTINTMLEAHVYLKRYTEERQCAECRTGDYVWII